MRPAWRTQGSPGRRTSDCKHPGNLYSESGFTFGAGLRTPFWAPLRVPRGRPNRHTPEPVTGRPVIRPNPPRRTPEPAPCPNQCVPVSRGYRHRHAANAVNALVARDIHAYHRSDYISAGRGQNACPQEESNGAATSDEIPVFARKLAEDSEQGRNGRSTERRQRHNGRSRHRRIDNETQKAQIHAKLKLRNRK